MLKTLKISPLKFSLLLFGLVLMAQNTVPQRLTIEIVEGEGAVNNIRQRTAREPIVIVRDENNKPVGQASVTFLLPKDGASGVFANGQQSLTVVTDALGRAVAQGLTPNDTAGRVRIQVTATFQALTAQAIINQINSVTGALATGGATAAGLSTGAKVAIVSSLAAAGTVTGIAVTREEDASPTGR